MSITSKRGNTIKRKAEPHDPAVLVARPGNDVVKKQSELEVEEKTSDDAHPEENDEEVATNGDAPANDDKNSGEKRPAEEDNVDEEPSKKAKVGRGRPKKVAGSMPAAATAAKKKAAAAAVEKKPATGEPDTAKKGRGRPKKEEGAATGTPKAKPAKKEKKPRAANGTGVGSRTRSAKK